MDRGALLEAEIERVAGVIEEQIARYLDWPRSMRHGRVMNTLYGDMIDFVNFRVETASSALALIRERRVGDGLALCRGLLENYLLLMLMARGNKYFLLRNLEDKLPEEFAQILAEERERFAAGTSDRASDLVDIRAYPRSRRRIMYVREGLRSGDDADDAMTVPLHYFRFRDFRPETMRLKPQDYFEYYEPDPELGKALKDHRASAAMVYQHYLSYESLLVCLNLNGLADEQVQRRIEAHYTFLGRFVHPTHDAARELHDGANSHSGLPAIGINGTYSVESRLLGLAYVAHLLAGILDEVCALVEAAPAKYMDEPGTADIRAATRHAVATVPYFWFLYNDASPHDKFVWAIHHATDEQLIRHNGYQGIPSDLVSFNAAIYGNFQSGLTGWFNSRCGAYEPPVRGFGGV
jgi:hypothetical protein